ncbi:hypothetical protein E1B28_012025 [Marasmius oreades]|uniref:Ricin B lectin domain-containing protein n=1 Tax=Marasmius oreades TaxID=181124 RepID=A0A9P7RQM1_9AGAR|nr:uncharacterized protein E1B28_012025 [Marasmius oreades]KAG7087986.1 hypothetical protein E1B28_012025 [Marasmius oreades]
MRSTAVLSLYAFVTVATASQIVSNSPAFTAAGRKGCITASSNADNAAVVIQDCNTTVAGQDWAYTPLSGALQQLRVLGDKCLDVTGGVNADGTKLQIFTCTTGNTNQLWLNFGDHTFQWSGTNKCVDLTDTNTNNGNQLQIFSCTPGNTNQQWTDQPIAPPTGGVRLREPSTTVPVCLTAVSNADNAALTLDHCGSPPAGANDTWVIPAPGTSGPITTFGGTKCLDVPNGNPANGNLLQVFTCVAGNTNQVWTVGAVAGKRQLSWSLPGQSSKCVDVKDSVLSPTGNAQIQIWDCDAGNLNTNQWWFPQ